MRVLKIKIVDWCYYCKYCHKEYVSNEDELGKLYQTLIKTECENPSNESGVCFEDCPLGGDPL